jgi:hypothetical protein
MYRQQRSYNTNLKQGMVDGSYKFYAPNRGGEVEDTTAQTRQQMSGAWHGFNETPTKILPDGSTFNSPGYYDITPLDDENI